jgi:hypothetical protein
MAEITPKFKMYLFLSILALFLNISVVMVNAFNGINTDFNPNRIELPKNYDSMTPTERKDWLYEKHDGIPTVQIETGDFYFPDGYIMTQFYYKDFLTGKITSGYLIDYSKSSDTDYVTKVAGVSGTSFLPFVSLIITDSYYEGAFPLNLIVGIIVGIIGVLQTLLILAVVLNQLPFFNV